MFASSASVYGMADVFPTTEQQHPYNNRTLYGAAKTFGEGLLRSFNDMYGLDYVALRYFNVYGPGMDLHGKYTEVLIRWMERIVRGEPPLIFGDGLQTMDFVHVEDVARANILAATMPVTDAVFNIGAGVETSLRDLARQLTKVMGRPDLLALHAGDNPVNPVRRRLADTGAAQNKLGFEAIDSPGGRTVGSRVLVENPAADRSTDGRCETLAVRGRSDVIPVAKPALYAAEAEAAREAVLSGWVTQGPQVAAFEREFAAFVGAEHACAVSSCTTALHLALLAVGVRPGDEVITASHSYIATANAIRYCGGVPVFVDIEPPGFNLDPELVSEAITSRTRAMLCVHQIGMPCDLTRLVAIANQSGVALSRTRPVPPEARSG